MHSPIRSLRHHAVRGSMCASMRGPIRVLSFLLLFSFCALIGSGQTSSGNQIQELPPNQTIEREMTGAETHRFKFDLQANEFFQVRVEQKGVDVALKLLDDKGTVLATMDSPNSKQGPETLSFVAAQPGGFVLEVSGFDPKAVKGNYSIRREEPRTATVNDRRRVEVERLFVRGIGGLAVKGQEEVALKELSEAQAGWEELADDYMRRLTTRQVILSGLNNELQTANSLVAEGQKLSGQKKEFALIARAKLNESLRAHRELNAKLNDRTLIDKTLIDKTVQLDDQSQQTLGFLEAVRYFSKLGEGISLSGIADTYSSLGESQEYVDYLKLAVVAYDEAIDLLAHTNLIGSNRKQVLLLKAGALQNIGGTLNTYLGQPAEALKFLNQALDLIQVLYQETKDPQLKLREALALRHMGSAYMSESQNRKASIESLWKAIEIYRSLPDMESEIADLLSLIGAAYSVDFNYEAALKNWNDAAEIYRRLDNRGGQMQVLLFKGAMYYLLDDKPKVSETFNRVLSILQSPDFTENYRKHLFQGLNLTAIEDERVNEMIDQMRLDRIGFAYERLEDYEKAIAYYEQALSVARNQKNPTGIRGDLQSIGWMFTKLEKWDKAAEFAKLAVDINRGRNLKEDMADDLTDLGSALLESGKPSEALEAQTEALALYQTVNVGTGKAFSPVYSRLLNELARTQDALGNRRLAIFYGKQGVNAMQGERQRLSSFDPVSQKGFLEKKEKHYRRLADWLIAEGRIIEAEQVLRMLKEEEVSNYLRHDESSADRLSLRIDFTATETKALKSYDENSRTISSLGTELGKLEELKKNGGQLTPENEKRYDELKTKLSEANADFEKFLDQLAVEFKQSKNPVREISEDTGLQSDMQEWGGDLAFIYTLVGEDRYRTILITPKARAAGEKEIKAVDLDRKILEFREEVKNPKVDPRPLGKELYDILIKPIEKELDGAKAKTLLWSLDGNLRLLPLAALWDGRQYFGQKYQNVVITLASRTRIGREVAANLNVLGLGVSEPKSVQEPLGERSLPFSALPGVPFELAAIVRSRNSPHGVLPGESLLNAEFTEKTFEKQLLNGYKVIHIASHFSLNAGDASRSFLLLGDGTTLTVNELNNNPALSFKGVELLTLSACETAVAGENGSGKEIDGFAYVAQTKGARAILATLWPVADASTQLLMSEFYRLRKEHPQMTKTEVMQFAQREMIEGKLRPATLTSQDRTSKRVAESATEAPAFPYDPKQPFAHPYYWAPFILIGNWK